MQSQVLRWVIPSKLKPSVKPWGCVCVRTQTLFIGSVKDNIGHVGAASGVAALIKTVLMIQNRTILKQANFVSLNPRIESLDKNSMGIAERSKGWPTHKRTALVNNYGAADSNAALVVQQYATAGSPDMEDTIVSSQRWPVLLSARTEMDLKSSLHIMNREMIELSTRRVPFSSVANRLASTQNIDFDYRWTSTACDAEYLALDLDSSVSNLHRIRRKSSLHLPIVLCFAGQTGTSISISEDLFQRCKLLRKHMVCWRFSLFSS